jgi:hypothetical protein
MIILINTNTFHLRLDLGLSLRPKALVGQTRSLGRRPKSVITLLTSTIVSRAIIPKENNMTYFTDPNKPLVTAHVRIPMFCPLTVIGFSLGGLHKPEPSENSRILPHHTHETTKRSRSGKESQPNLKLCVVRTLNLQDTDLVLISQFRFVKNALSIQREGIATPPVAQHVLLNLNATIIRMVRRGVL